MCTNIELHQCFSPVISSSEAVLVLCRQQAERERGAMPPKYLQELKAILGDESAPAILKRPSGSAGALKRPAASIPAVDPKVPKNDDDDGTRNRMKQYYFNQVFLCLFPPFECLFLSPGFGDHAAECARGVRDREE